MMNAPKNNIRAPTAVEIAIWEKYNIEHPIPEYRFSLQRKWRIDYAWPDYMIALEIEGGIYIGGRHINPKGYLKDLEKYNKMCEEGWQLLRFQPKRINYIQIKNTIDNAKKRIKALKTEGKNDYIEQYRKAIISK